MSNLYEGGMGMESISRVDTRMPGQTRQDRFSDGDLIGFFRDAHLQQRFLALVGRERQQMRRFVLGAGRSAHRFAVQGHCFLVLLRATGLDPGG